MTASLSIEQRRRDEHERAGKRLQMGRWEKRGDQYEWIGELWVDVAPVPAPVPAPTPQPQQVVMVWIHDGRLL